ncbi:MAG: TolB-like protein, partial [Cyclobacteriaceae bacterium]
MVALTDFFTELKRRNVVRVALAYAVVSWIITQAADTLESVLLLPEWFTTAIVAALLLGFPVALLISWAYELTPEGLIPTAEVNATDSVIHKTAKRLDIVTIGAVCVAVVLMFVRPYIVPQGPSEETSLPENSRVAELIADASDDNEPEVDAASIAVLPFINLSSDPEQEYFSDGISEELLNLFAKIPDLRVAARTSSFQFKDKNLDVPEIGKQLNVAHVLEGSVRKSGTTLRITAQLIEAESGFHLWSETYDRELVDIFAIQDEISMAIVEALSDILGVVSAADTPTIVRSDSTAAYEAYLQGNALYNRLTDKDLQAAQLQFDRAIELDPNFAPAYTGLAGTYLMRLASGSTYGTLSLAEVLTKATPLIERALELAPTLAAAHRRRGQLLNMQGRYNESVRSLRVALDFNPNDASIYNSLA